MSNKQLIIFNLIPNIGISGSDVRLINILKNIPKKNINITIVGTKNLPSQLIANKVKFKHILIETKTNSNSLIVICFIATINILKAFSSFKPSPNSIIYSSSDLYWETIPAFFYCPKVKSWIQVIHHIYPNWKTRPGNPIINFLGFYFQRLSFFLIKKRANTIIVVNSLVKKELIKLGFNSHKIVISSNGINLKHHKINKNKKYDAVFLGRLDPSKGVNDIVPIWSKVCQKIPQAKLALIGGTLNQNLIQLKKQINQGKLNKNIKILGFVDDFQKEKILAQSKLFILPSHEEGWGISIAEAMSFKLPVICWQLQNLKKIFKNQPFFVKPFNYQKFSQQIISLLNQPKLIQSNGITNQKFVQQFSWEKIVKQEYKIICS